ncbi:unnamed protein product [Clavelina lepadiformis]|uniref:Uncharacterized protein n=1 Tax=Clavelina lepadiformis TaxID=159417 RepID=A0ABP0FYH5_CLALP
MSYAAYEVLARVPLCYPTQNKQLFNVLFALEPWRPDNARCFMIASEVSSGVGRSKTMRKTSSPDFYARKRIVSLPIIRISRHADAYTGALKGTSASQCSPCVFTALRRTCVVFARPRDEYSKKDF